jgi:hypothetical protein
MYELVAMQVARCDVRCDQLLGTSGRLVSLNQLLLHRTHNGQKPIFELGAI